LDVSVVVVAYNEERNIGECLDSLLRQQYTKGKYEIVVVDGCSKDRTAEIAESYAKSHPFIRLIRNPGRTIPSNRNAGIRNSQYPYIAFTDADCICPPDWLEKLTDGYIQCLREGVNVGAVGGGNISDDQFGSVSAAIGIAFDTPFSSLGTQQTRIWKTRKEVESLATLNVLYKKSIFDEVTYFDESKKLSATDWVLNYHLRKRGYKLFYIPDVVILHKMRTTLPSFAKQMLRYGIGRGIVIRGDPRTLTWRYVLPIVFLLIMTLSVPLYAFSGIPLFAVPWLYFPFILIISAIQCARKRSLRLLPLVFFIFLIIHFVYSFGECIGLARGK